jgi:hypothetical protein
VSARLAYHERMLLALGVAGAPRARRLAALGLLGVTLLAGAGAGAGASLVACVPDTAVGPAPTSARPVASPPAPDASAVGAAADASATIVAVNERQTAVRTPVPEGPAKWRSVPREQNGFYAVLDGICSQLGAGRVGKDVVVHYGGGHNPMYYDGVRAGAASFIAMRDDGLESIGDPVLNAPTGIAGKSLDDFWIADSTGTRSSDGAILHRYLNGTWKTQSKDQTNLHAWVDGGTIGSLGFAAANGDIWVEGSSTKPPKALWSDLPFPALSAFPTGDVLIVANKDTGGGAFSGPLVARHWAPGKKVTEHPLDRLLARGPADGGGAWVYEVAPDEVYVARTDHVVRWDGTAFRALAKTNKGEVIGRIRRAAADDLWVLTSSGAIQHLTATTATPIATPEVVVDMDGVENGGAWIVGKSGKLYRRDTEEWKQVPLPPPPFTAGATLKAKAVLVAAPDDVLFTGMYWEKGPGWKDQELHTALFRTRRVKETLRCNEPDPENNNINLGHGFQSWPPMVNATNEAAASCPAPFVVLARRSRAIKNDDDWPRLRAALKGHPELGEMALVDFVSGDRTFVGARAKDLDTAKRIVAVISAKDRLRPEIVCGDPDAKRTLVVDLATGTAAAK